MQAGYNGRMGKFMFVKSVGANHDILLVVAGVAPPAPPPHVGPLWITLPTLHTPVHMRCKEHVFHIRYAKIAAKNFVNSP